MIIWAGFIFTMSNMNIAESNNQSKSTISTIIDGTLNITNDFGITTKKPDKTKKNQIINKYNYIVRRTAHVIEYLIFTILIIIALHSNGLKGKKVYIIALLICFIYACTDEYHQTFIEGRTGQFYDCLVDLVGGLLGCSFMIAIKKIKQLRKTN